jgi:hypothetical protein
MKQSVIAIIASVALAGGAALTAQQAPPAAAKPEAAAPAKAAAPSPAGKWLMALESPQGAMSVNLDVKVDAAGKVTGTLDSPNGPTPIKGEVKEGVLGFTISFDAGGQMVEIYFEGKIKDDGKMAGTMSLGDMGSFPFTAERAKGL